MNIVVVGAGTIGCYLARMLSKEEHNVTLIDIDEARLEGAAREMDIATRFGSGTDWQLLEELLELGPTHLMAMTNQTEVNLVCCDLAKHLGYVGTVARVQNIQFLNRARLDFSHIFDSDDFVCPELLVATEIYEYIMSPSSLALESFSHGAVLLRTLAVPERWTLSHTPLHKLGLPKGVMVGLIKRGKTVRFPHGDDVIIPGDEVTLIGEAEPISHLHQFFGIEEKKIESVAIVGGSLVGVNLARLLERQRIDVRLLDCDPVRCAQLTRLLPQTTIINHSGIDIEFLRVEKFEASELFVGATNRDEVNLLSILAGQEVGCSQTAAVLTNDLLKPLFDRVKVGFVSSPRIAAANRVLSRLHSGTVSSLKVLYENRAQVLEVFVSVRCKLVGIPLAELGPLLPEDFLFATIENRGAHHGR